MSVTSFLVRKMFEKGDNKRDAGLSTPQDIDRFDNIQYGPDQKWNQLDVYRPKDRAVPLPVIVSIHGGGWVYGDKERYQYYCMNLAQNGFAVINFTYRLAPKYKFPAPLEDTNLVFRWLFSNAELYGLDKTRVFCVGDSAGAQLLGLYCCICTNPDYASLYSFQPPEHFIPKGIALNCGVYQISRSSRKDLTARLMADYLPEKGTDSELRQISVLEHMNKDFPCTFLMTAEGDFLAEAAPPMAEKLRTLGVPVVYRYYGNKNHVLGHVFHCNIRLEAALQCNRDECDFFRSLSA